MDENPGNVEKMAEKKEKDEQSKMVDSGGGGEAAGCSKTDSECSTSQAKTNLQESSSDLASAGCSKGVFIHKGSNENKSNEGTSNRSSESRSETDEQHQSLTKSLRFPRRRRSSGRQYRRRSEPDELSGDEQPGQRSTFSTADIMFREWAATAGETLESFSLSSSSSDSSHSSMSEVEDTETRAQVIEENSPTPKVLLKPKPVHKWFALREVTNRELGWGSRWQGPERFQHRYYGSLHAVQRLELMYKLDEHRGCVNSLNFNRSGELLVSASDDRRVVLWDWAADRSVLSYDSGHTGNVFQAKFLPLSGDRHIVTCARDGQVRLSVLSGVGVCKGTRLLAQHRRTTHKLAIHPDTPHVFLSAGEDALVLSHDVRTNKATKLLFVKEGGNKMGLYSIHSNPVCSNEFIVTGEDQYIRLYDKRKISEGSPLKKFCPKHLVKPDAFLHVTCAVFNYNGTEVIASYNDDDIYLFDTRLPSEADYVHKYEGHRNSITVKGVNFFGPRSEFIVSGSDCGNIFFWDKSTESIVQWMRGDEEGVVNCLEPHPQVPIIATSGLDSDIKIWVPSCEQEPTLKGLKTTVIDNQRKRDESRSHRSEPFDNQQMRWLWRQIQRFEQRRSATNDPTARTEGEQREQPSEGRERVGTSSSSSEDEAEGRRPQCSPS